MNQFPVFRQHILAEWTLVCLGRMIKVEHRRVTDKELLSVTTNMYY
jgi:hypothetical protein